MNVHHSNFNLEALIKDNLDFIKKGAEGSDYLHSLVKGDTDKLKYKERLIRTEKEYIRLNLFDLRRRKLRKQINK